jgi:hypothetical protein
MEQNNLAGQKPELEQRLREQVIDFIETHNQGIHMRCHLPRQSTAEVHVAFSRTLSSIQPLTLELDDTVSVTPSRRTFDTRLRSGPNLNSDADTDGLLVQFFEASGGVSVDAQSEEFTFYLGRSKTAHRGAIQFSTTDSRALDLPLRDWVPDGDESPSWCQFWSVHSSSPVADAELSAEDVERLEALGYLK